MHRQTIYSQTLADQIYERLAEGESLKDICDDSHMPSKATVFRWLRDNEAFRDLYALAREDQAETLADEIVAIADEECTMIKASKHRPPRGDDSDESVDEDIEVTFDLTAVTRNKLRIDARKWVASKLKPRKYGDRVNLDHSGTLSLEQLVTGSGSKPE